MYLLFDKIMAAKSQEKALKKLEDQLTCAICLEVFKDPKLLQCFHVYCKECLDRLVVTDQQGQVSVRCPTCRRATLLPPATTVADLQSAFHIHHLFEIQDAFEKVKEPQKVQCGLCLKDVRTATSYCRDCGEFICATCVDTHTQWGTLAKHEVIGLDQFKVKVKQLDALKKVTLYCSLHQGKELELYCESCEELICHNCTVKKHKNHQYDMVSDIFEEQTAKITASLEPVEMQLETLKRAVREIIAKSKAVNGNREEVEAEINKKTQQLHDAIELGKAELLRELNEETQKMLKELSTQKDELETIETQLTSCVAFVKESMRRGSEGEIMKMKKGVMRQIKEITESIKPEQLSPHEIPKVKFSPSPELEQKCKQFGKIHTTQNASPEKSYATGKGLEVAVRGEKATAIVHLVDEEGEVCLEPAESLSCELTSDTNSDKVKCSVKNTKDSQFEISYKPTSRGRHQVHIKVKGEHIKGSPFSVAVKLPVKELGNPVRTINGVNQPWGVAINQQGEVVVTEGGGHCVSVFSSTGEKIRSFGSHGTGHGQFNQPFGVAIDDDGNILVVEYSNHRIQKFSSDGRFIAAVGTKGSGQLQFYHPFGIKINPQTKRVYVAEEFNHRVQVLQPDLTFFSKFGHQGNGPGQLSHPCDVAFDSANNVYVTDWNNHQIQVFSENGEYLRQIGKSGAGPGELKNPCMIAIDDEDKIYVTEYSNNRVSVFTSHGGYLTSFGLWGSGPGQLPYPRGIAVDNLGMVYVCVEDKNRVQIF